MWVILCTTVWLQFATEQAARSEYETFPDTATALSCSAPQYASEADLGFYASKQYFPMRIGSLASIVGKNEQEEYQRIFDENTTDALKVASEKPEEKEATPEAVKESDQAPKTVSSTDRKCQYWWTHPKPHVYQLNQKCKGTT